MTYKFYPSSSAFMVGEVVVTKYDSGCLRAILIKSHGVTAGDIPQAYADVGLASEEQHAADLSAEGLQFTREVSIKVPLSPTVTYSGRADFVVNFPKAGTVIDECKGTISKNTRKDAIRNGEYNISYLAQLVSYMVRFKTQKGRLVCGYYEETHEAEPKLVRQEERTFKVEISDDGNISVDGEPSGYCVADLFAHQRAAVRVLENQEVAARPDKWRQKYGGPCTYCPFKIACDKFDSGCEGPAALMPAAEALVYLARRAVEALPAKPEPKPNKIKQPKKAG